MKKKSLMDGPLKTVLFVLILLAMCVIFSVYNLMGTASTLFNVCFERSDADLLLEQDEEWYGTDAERAARAEAAAEGAAALSGLTAVTGEYATASAGSRYLRGETTLGYTAYLQDGPAAVILLHGYNRDAAFAEMVAAYWAERGCDVVVPQLRGHDGNEGVTALGYYEQFDLLDLMEALRDQQGLTDFILHGQGMGAAAALLLSGNEELTARLRGDGLTLRLIVAESAYTTLNELIELQLPRQFSMKGFAYSWSMRAVIDQYLGFFAREADVLSAVGRSETPTVFVCGSEDGFVPASMTERLYAACSGEKALLSVPGARFGCAWTQGRSSYAALLDAWS